MVQSLAGDRAAYSILLQRLNGHLRAYYLRRLGSGRAADAEDLLQETLIAMHARRSTYDTSRPFTAWVHAIARYKLIDHFRRTKRRAEDSLDDPGQLFAFSDANAVEAQIDVDRLLQRLPEKTRRLVRDVKIHGLSTAEAADSPTPTREVAAVQAIYHLGREKSNGGHVARVGMRGEATCIGYRGQTPAQFDLRFNLTRLR